ncbi:hypothetical protein FACS1894139_06070 [Planctomycetales bacterium]|nr:hypothetical protein FACS1894107_00420 [Planctomycetales bacterium]GHS96185.1 hypothetical protein FACS1894108_00370 [Planctomycetales bacterium]GHT04247.1 hypothetical protein FACS1894139_06070 [Planctomycetales bacterium]
MWKFLPVLALAVSATAAENLSAPPPFDQPAVSPAAELLRLLNFERVYDGALRQQMQELAAQLPLAAQHADELQQFSEQYLNYATLKPQIEAAYTTTFSDGELTELVNFFATPTGRKWAEKYPELLRQVREIGAAQTRAHAAELQQILTGNLPAAAPEAVPALAAPEAAKDERMPDDEW